MENHRSFTCSVCYQHFKLETSLDEHILAKHLINAPGFSTVSNTHDVFKCCHCSMKCKTKLGLHQHNYRKHKYLTTPLKQLISQVVQYNNKTCDYCSHKFNNLADLESHKKLRHENINYFSCRSCPLIFSSNVSRINHMEEAHPVQCGYCSSKFESNQYLRQHVESHHKNTRDCTVCFKTFKQAWDLQQHQYAKNHKNIDYIPNSQVSPLCATSNTYFNTGKNNSTEATIKSHTCNICFKTFKKAFDLLQHQQAANHKNVDYIPNNQMPLTYGTSNTYFKTSKNIHREATMNVNSCSICFKTFKNFLDLQQHQHSKNHKNVHYVPHGKQLPSSDTTSNDYCEEVHALDTDTNNQPAKHHKKVNCLSNRQIASSSTASNNYLEGNLTPITDTNNNQNAKQHKNVVSHGANNDCVQEIYIVDADSTNHTESTTTLTCRYCDKKFSTDFVLKNHQEFKHKNIDYFPCQRCQEVFTANVSRRRHFLTVHQGTGSYHIKLFSEGVKTMENICKHCAKHFKSSEQLQEHAKAEHE